MNFLKKLSRRRRTAPVTLSRSSAGGGGGRHSQEEKLYSLGELSTLDGFGLMKALMLHRHRPIAHYLAGIGKRRSMLHADVLLLLYYLARHAPGDILEIGPYIGGSTIAAAQGMRDSGRPRKFSDRRTRRAFRASEDSEHRYRARPKAESGHSRRFRSGAGDRGRRARWREQKPPSANSCAPASVGLLVMDADGAVEAALAAHRDLLRDPCWVVIDDYYATGMALDKAIRTKTEIDALVGAGELEALGLFGWGTWFGRWHRTSART